MQSGYRPSWSIFMEGICIMTSFSSPLTQHWHHPTSGPNYKTHAYGSSSLQDVSGGYENPTPWREHEDVYHNYYVEKVRRESSSLPIMTPAIKATPEKRPTRLLRWTASAGTEHDLSKRCSGPAIAPFDGSPSPGTAIPLLFPLLLCFPTFKKIFERQIKIYNIVSVFSRSRNEKLKLK